MTKKAAIGLTKAIALRDQCFSVIVLLGRLF